MSAAVELYKEGEKLKDAGKNPEAIEKFLAAAAADPAYALPHLALAVTYGRVKEHEKAIAHAQKACELDPQDAFSFTTLSVTYQRAFAGTQQRDYIRLAEEAMARAHTLQGRR